MAGVDTVEIAVIGAGVIGLAVARRLAERGRDVLVLEQHDGFGRETSSRNSEVIHAGLYYAHDLEKTQLCVRGNPLLYELCRRAGIPHRNTGKLVVATTPAEVEHLDRIEGQAKRNGVPGVDRLDRRRLQEMECAVEGLEALYSATTGIVDTHALMAWLEAEAKTKGATVAYGCRVSGLARTRSFYEIEVTESGAGRSVVGAGRVVCSAGLGADEIAALAGIDVDTAGCRLRRCKGEYFRISDRHRGVLSHLVYPTPSPVHLGAHAVLGLDGSLRLGPSSVYVEELDYSVDPGHAREFLEQARRFLPFLTAEDLSPDQSGIRPKLYRHGEPFRDFVIRDEGDRGLPGLISLVGMESPGLTACLAIAERVEGLL